MSKYYDWRLAIKVSMVVVAMLLLLAAVSSCQGPPTGTLLRDIDGKPTLVVDADSDNVPDVDADGRVIIVKDSVEILGIGEKVDTFLPVGLDVLAAFGVPFAGLAASVIRQRKLGRVLANTVLSVQHMRRSVSERGVGEALKIVDNALVGSQVGETVDFIKKVKDDLGLVSVTGSTSS